MKFEQLWPVHGLKALDGSKLPCSKIAVSLIEQIKNQKVDYVRAHHYADNDPNYAFLNMETVLDSLQRVVLETIFALARIHEVDFISISGSDLISDVGAKFTRKDPFARPFTWEVLSALGMRGSCGNGRTDKIYQYQLPYYFFHEKYYGIYDPKTGKKFFDHPLYLKTYGKVMTQVHEIIQSKQDVTARIDEIFRNQSHEWGKAR